MPRPRLTLYTELSSPELVKLFAHEAVYGFLERTGSRLTMAMLDFDPERAEIIRRLEGSGIGVAAWMLVDRADGYWLNADNALVAQARYRQLRDWARRERVKLDRIGLDIEPSRDMADGLMVEPVGAFLRALTRRRHPIELAHAERMYDELVDEIHADGRSVESYQYPHVTDERRAMSSLIRRTLGIVNVTVDREVLMLYRSWMGPEGVRAYLPDASSVVVGVTGGGVNEGRHDIEPTIGWEELREDLLLASRHVDDVSIFSLEGCVQQDMLDKIETLDWDASVADGPGALAMLRAHYERGAIQWVARCEGALDRWLPVRRAPLRSTPPPRPTAAPAETDTGF